MARIDTSSANWLLAKKVGVTGAIAFLAVFIPGVLNVLNSTAEGEPFDFDSTFWVSLIAAAFAAGLRAVVAVLPWNLLPTDAFHGFGKEKPDVVEVTAMPHPNPSRAAPDAPGDQRLARPPARGATLCSVATVAHRLGLDVSELGARPVTCPAGTPIAQSTESASPAVLCRVTDSLVSAARDPSALLAYCTGDHTACPVWREDRDRWLARRKSLLAERDPEPERRLDREMWDEGEGVTVTPEEMGR